jgi:metal-sulfur cluster biosynthetic enzyme
MSVTLDVVQAKLRECRDPEVPCNIVDLGLVYDVRVEPIDDARSNVAVKMTLTAEGCPLARQIVGSVEEKLRQIPGVATAQVELVFDPPWDASRISAEGRRQLRMT